MLLDITKCGGKDHLKLQNNSRLWIFQNDGDNTLFGGKCVHQSIHHLMELDMGCCKNNC